MNRVSFDPSKEHLVILHPTLGEGDPFRLLGCQIDTKLLMTHAIDKILAQARPKIQAILRTRAHYSTQDLVGQFKTHIWGILEIHNGAIFHASDYLLAKIDAVQRHFLNEIDITEKDAYMQHNFAPPQLRRNIGMLGLLHKRVLGEAHPIFQELFPFHDDVFGSLRPGEHDKQLYGHLFEVNFQLQLHLRSIFAMVYVYNRLPQYVVNKTSVTEFQKELSIIARHRCQNDIDGWEQTFSCRV